MVFKHYQNKLSVLIWGQMYQSDYINPIEILYYYTVI